MTGFRFWIVGILSLVSMTSALGQSLAGIDVLQAENFQSLRGQRVGLITNHTGVNLRGVSTVELLSDANGVELVALFSPEHGFAGKLDQAKIGDAEDATTGLKIHSLYGETRVPTPAMLSGIDTLVFDIQDIGTRFYTYVSTMGGAMRAASENGIRFVVLDRPNPINGVTTSGPVLDPGSESFVGYHPIAVRHGMTVGELAKMFQAELDLKLELKIVAVKQWDRNQFFDATGRTWINPSPNMRSLTQAMLYPGVGLLETTNLSVGRGTDTPFEVVGAPWIDAIAFAAALRSAEVPGVTFIPIQFTPDASKFRDELCGGVNIVITNREVFEPVKVGLLLAVTLRSMYSNQWETKSLNRLLADAATRDAILNGKSVEAIKKVYAAELEAFRDRRSKYLIYPAK